MTYDLILRKARLIDPSQRLDAVADIAFAEGKVARIGADLKADAGTDVRDMAGTILWLASEAGSYVTGQLLNLNGGLYFA